MARTTAASAAAPAPSARVFSCLEQKKNGTGDFFVVHGNDLVDVARDEGQGEVAGSAHSDAVGDSGFRGDRDRLTRLAGAQHGGQLLGLNADHADAGIGFLEGTGDSADESAAPNGHDHGFNIRHLLEQFEADGALAGDDFRVVEGMDEGATLFEPPAESFFAGFVVAGAVEDDVCAVIARRGDLDQRSGQRHHDLGTNSACSGVEGHSLRMVAGAGSDDAALAFGLRKGEQLVERPALFERAGAL